MGCFNLRDILYVLLLILIMFVCNEDFVILRCMYNYNKFIISIKSISFIIFGK